MDSDWAAQRREAVGHHAAHLRRRQEADNSRAQALLETFSEAALRAGLATSRLVVTGYGGRGRVTSDVEGWYVRNDRTMGVGIDGGLYALTAPLSLLDRVRGIHLAPIAPPLVLGAGGRDGDSIDLADALERVLPGWRDQPAPGTRGRDGTAPRD